MSDQKAFNRVDSPFTSKENWINVTAACLRFRHWVCMIAMVVYPNFSISQTTFTPQTFNGRGGMLHYQVLMPMDFSDAKEYPMLVFLHGSGERGDDNKKQLVHGSKIFLDSENQENYPAIVIFPQCPENDFWAQADIIDGKERGGRLKFQYKDEPNPSLSLVIQLMDSLLSKPFVDKERIYIGGLSMGGMGTFELLARKPYTFAAAFPICGGGDAQSASKYAGNIKLWIFHGAKDNVVFPDYSVEMALALQKAGSIPRFTLYKNANHNSWDSAFAEPELLPWLFSQKKSDRDE